MSAYEGACSGCGGALVQVIEDGVIETTYHPAVAVVKGKTCPDLLPIRGTEDWPEPSLSLRVPDKNFTRAGFPTTEQIKALNRMEREA